MKKMRFICVVALIAVVLVGCAPPTTPEATPPPTTEAPIMDVSTLEGWAAYVRSKYEGVEIKVAAATHPSIEAFKKMTSLPTKI